MFDIEEELKKLPGKPGVYIMHDDRDEIIYVGKAISLKNRVRQYFQSSRNKGVKIEQMVTHIARFEYIVTDSELEALVLECNLIKEHRPKYNTMLKDDKTYPFIKVTVHEDYPRILFSRRMKKDKNKYFGPYSSAGAVQDTIELIRKQFQVTILLIEHDMKLVAGICEYLYVLNFGTELANGTPEEVLNDPRVITAYLGE